MTACYCRITTLFKAEEAAPTQITMPAPQVGLRVSHFSYLQATHLFESVYGKEIFRNYVFQRVMMRFQCQAGDSITTLRCLVSIWWYNHASFASICLFLVLKQPVQFSVGLELGCLKSSITLFLYVLSSNIAFESPFCFSGKGDDSVVRIYDCLTFTS